MRCYPHFSKVHDSADEPLIIHRHGDAPGRALLVFIHGLGGERYGTWTPKGRDPCHVGFPKFLYEDITGLDVGLYAYRTALGRLRWWRSIELEVEAKVLADRLRDCAKDYSFIFLAGHSMGGILARAAVHQLIDRSDSKTLASISGLFMLASPMAGSLRVPGILSWFSADMRALRPHGRLVSRTADAFKDRVVAYPAQKQNQNQYVIPAWVVAGAEDKWVDQFSAGLEVTRDRINNVRGSHTSTVKPGNKTDDVYIWVRDILIGISHVSAVSGSTLHPVPPNKVILTLSAPTVVDESAIKEAFARYEAEWPAVEVRWPQSADDLVRVLREGLELLDKGGGAIEGAHTFAENVPEQLRRIPEDRRRIEQLIPSLVKRVRNLSEHQRIKAVIGLLRYANLRIHQAGAYYASWQGLTAFGLQRPPAWDGLTKWSLLKGEGSDEATVAAVLGKRGEPVVQALLVNAAGIHIEEESGRSGYFTPGVYVCVPERFASTITTRPYNLPIDELLWWVIPQLEYNATPRCVRALPDAYSTQWSFEKLLGE